MAIRMMFMPAVGMLLRSVMSLMSAPVAANVLMTLIEVVAVACWQATRRLIICWVTKVAADGVKVQLSPGLFELL